MHSTKLSVFCAKILEAGWLLAVIITPLFFNIWSDRVFEPDKLTTLRSVALVMAVVWLVKWVEERVSGRRGLELTWRTPLILPTVFTVLVYLLSAALSVTPRVSFFGSYQRLQGTYTTLSYIVLFFIIVQELRTRDQVDRLITVVILNSLPIALYGFLQRNSLDPLPWGGDVTQRIASNMGNPIFVAAYLIMAAFPTLSRVIDSFRSILADEEESGADVLRAAAYIFIFLVQVIAVWYTSSRGPQMGLLAGLGIWVFLGLIALLRAAQREQPFEPGQLLEDIGRGLAFGVGSVALVAAVAAASYFIARAIAGPESSIPQWVALGLSALVLLGTWMVFVANRWGWRWLWIGVLLMAVGLAAGFLVINLVEPVRAWSQQQPWLGRLDDVLQYEGGTGKVRALLWEQALELFLPHEPLEKPPTVSHSYGWQPDQLNALRPLIGYGPESMFVAANRFYPPDLAHYESRTSSGDRAHNETMDTLVITGVLGFGAYLWLFGSIFYFGLRWVGFLPEDWRRTVFFALLGSGAVIATVVTSILIGPHFLGLAIPIGMVGGLFLYLVVYAFSLHWEPEAVSEGHPHFVLLAGLLAAIVAHLVEINFGIAIASTRTTFWAYAGVFVVLGLNLLDGQSAELEPESSRGEQAAGSRKRKKRRRVVSPPSSVAVNLPDWLGPTLAVAVIGGFILGTLAFDLSGTNPDRIEQAEDLFWQSMTVLPGRSQGSCQAMWDPLNGQCRSYGVLMLFGLTWLMNGIVFIAQMAKSGLFRAHRGDLPLAVVIYVLVSSVIGFGFALLLNGRLTLLITSPPDDINELASRILGQLTLYYWFILFTMLVGGVVLCLRVQRWPRLFAQPLGLVVLLVLAILAGFTLVRTNLHPIQADMIYKQGSYARQSGSWPEALWYDQQAVSLDPQQDQYYLYLAMDLQQYIWSLGDSDLRDEALREFERVALQAQDLNPLATDHSVNLARVYQTWWQTATDAAERQALADRTGHYYDAASRLSPRNALIWNHWAQFLANLGEFELAQQKLDRSFELDIEFGETWILQAAVFASQNLITETIGAYQQALALQPDQVDVLIRLGDAYRYQGLITDAIEVYGQALDLNPNYVDAWLTLGDTYMGQNRLEEAALAYERALALNSSQPRVWRVLASVYIQLNRAGEAISALQRVLELDPNLSDIWDVHRLLAILYSQTGQGAEALYHAQVALQLAPEERQPELQELLDQLLASPEGAQP